MTPETKPDTTPVDLFSMDVAEAAARGADLQLRHPSSGRPMNIFLTLVGTDSQQYRDAYRRVLDAGQRDGGRVADASVYERRAAETCAASCLGWHQLGEDGSRVEAILWNGERLEFSPGNATSVFYARAWIREQIETFIGRRDNFFADSAGISAD